MTIDITNINTSKLGFGKDLREEVAGKVEEAKKVKGNARLDVILNGAEAVIKSGDKKSLELLRDSIDYAIKNS